MLRRIPRRLPTVLIFAGLLMMPAFYYAVSLTLRHEAACAGGDAGCMADAVFWRELAIAGFVAGLLISTVGVVLDRLRGKARP